MKLSELSNTSLRVMSAMVMLIGLGIIIALEHFMPQLHATSFAGVIIMTGAIYETIKCLRASDSETFKKHNVSFIAFLVWLILMLFAAFYVGMHPWIILWLLFIIVGADVGAWLFGKMFGGDKMWERLSEHKTWSGQIGGIICGTLMSVVFFMYFKPFGNDILFSVLFGCTIALLSQYGDLTASFIKRCLGIKDFSNLFPGHGGIMDRFDGWIYVLPFIWFFI